MDPTAAPQSVAPYTTPFMGAQQQNSLVGAPQLSPTMPMSNPNMGMGLQSTLGAQNQPLNQPLPPNVLQMIQALQGGSQGATPQAQSFQGGG